MGKVQWFFVAPVIVVTLLFAMQQGASAALRAYSGTTDYSGWAEYWDTVPDTSTPGHYYMVYDYDADGYGVRMRYRTSSGTIDYIDQTAGAGSAIGYNASSYTTAILACNRDKLSNGTIRVFNCDTWRWV